ncbi:hypothetical protein [Desulfosporosinus lacus]|uniref:Uncharacterized protein n=1 Tax=Desulfosporosinus lacus DSM 15449 TaxID=1121420 RepID=A0A1M6A296_9FIRM|nr:hypothetical protein [Desulfosporosinus lacus]SHI30439.1 hypothetical protein SAMN02746098_03861 [Desulfosporosinus lacus DSM 15449]
MREDFNNIEAESDQQQNAANAAEGSIPFTDLFSSQFMQQYTQFDSIDELLSSGGFEVNSEEDYEAISDEDIDAHVVKTTKFNSWKEMLTNAIATEFTMK